MAVLLSEFLVQQAPNKVETKKAIGRQFLSPGEIKEAIRLSKNYRMDGTRPADATALMFFQTQVQQTWLIRTEKRLYCILDDLRKPTAHVNWSTSINDLVATDGKKLRIDITVRERDNGSKQTGLLDIGPNHKNWLYSKKLFTSEPPERIVSRLILGN